MSKTNDGRIYIISTRPKKLLWAGYDKKRAEVKLCYFINHGENAYFFDTDEDLKTVAKTYKIDEFTEIEE